MVSIKPICERFDNLYDLSDSDAIKSVRKLKIQIEEAYVDPTMEEGITKDWLVWIYGKVANQTRESNEDIMAHYARIVADYDQLSRKISRSDKYRTTSMYKIMMLPEKAINELNKEPPAE